MSSSSLSEFLNGQGRFSSPRVLNLAKKLKLSPEHSEHWINLIDWKFGRTSELQKKAQLKVQNRIKTSQAILDLESFKFISKWEALALLEILGFEKKIQTAKIAQLLGLKPLQINQLIKSLLRLNLIWWDQNRWRPSTEDTFVGVELPSKDIQNFHRQILNRAQRALKKQDLKQREFRSTIFGFRKKDLPRLKEDLNRMWMELIGKYSLPQGSDGLYCFSFQLFNLLEGEIHND